MGRWLLLLAALFTWAWAAESRIEADFLRWATTAPQTYAHRATEKSCVGLVAAVFPEQDAGVMVAVHRGRSVDLARRIWTTENRAIDWVGSEELPSPPTSSSEEDFDSSSHHPSRFGWFVGLCGHAPDCRAMRSEVHDLITSHMEQYSELPSGVFLGRQVSLFGLRSLYPDAMNVISRNKERSPRGEKSTIGRPLAVRTILLTTQSCNEDGSTELICVEPTGAVRRECEVIAVGSTEKTTSVSETVAEIKALLKKTHDDLRNLTKGDGRVKEICLQLTKDLDSLLATPSEHLASERVILTPTFCTMDVRTRRNIVDLISAT